MNWYSWIVVILCLTSIVASPVAIGKPRTASEMAVNAVMLLFMTWVILKLEGVL